MRSLLRNLRWSENPQPLLNIRIPFFPLHGHLVTFTGLRSPVLISPFALNLFLETCLICTLYLTYYPLCSLLQAAPFHTTPFRTAQLLTIPHPNGGQNARYHEALWLQTLYIERFNDSYRNYALQIPHRYLHVLC